jgi:hypothetical protein
MMAASLRSTRGAATIGPSRKLPTPDATPYAFQEIRLWTVSFLVIFEAIATLREVELLAWLTDVLERMVSGWTKAHELERLLPWAWKAERLAAIVDA